MNSIAAFMKALPEIKNYDQFGVYPESINKVNESWLFMMRDEEDKRDYLIVYGNEADRFLGERVNLDNLTYVKAPLNHENALVLRNILPFTAPIRVLGYPRSVGVGDRLGIACPGHIRVFKEYDAYPVFAQQSIRELNLTNRSYEDVLDHVSYSVFREGYKRGFGADGDHLKKPEEVAYALRVGYTMITLDASDYIQNKDIALKQEVNLSPKMRERYLNKEFIVEDEKLIFSEEELKRAVYIYGKAIDYAIEIFNNFIGNGKADVDFEISIDETSTPTMPVHHFFVANELKEANVTFQTLAPRFCGEFQKGVDFIGDLNEFEKTLNVHAKIAQHFGYKISIHSGSDKFSTFELFGKYTDGHFHLKTAGTNWLEAMKTIVICDPKLYRRIHKFALSIFEKAKEFYHVTTDLTKIPNIDTLSDFELLSLFQQNDARQLIHITYGFILNAKDDNGEFLFKNQLFQIWNENQEVYAKLLHQHIGKHLALLHQGFQK